MFEAGLMQNVGVMKGGRKGKKVFYTEMERPTEDDLENIVLNRAGPLGYVFSGCPWRP